MDKEIYFAGGCFWGTEHFFKQINGVMSTQVGYANGNIENPTYEQVYTDSTGFAEVVKVAYDPKVVSLEMLLDLFFKTIDPTSLNQQGEDIGTRYRTGIYWVNSEDEKAVTEALSELQKKYEKPIVVENEPLKNFYSGEEYHQDYLDKNPSGYCHINPELFELAKKANLKWFYPKKLQNLNWILPLYKRLIQEPMLSRQRGLLVELIHLLLVIM